MNQHLRKTIATIFVGGISLVELQVSSVESHLREPLEDSSAETAAMAEPSAVLDTSFEMDRDHDQVDAEGLSWFYPAMAVGASFSLFQLWALHMAWQAADARHLRRLQPRMRILDAAP